MKHLFSILFLTFVCLGNVTQAQEIGVMLTDNDAATNVRSAPRGEVVMTLPDTCSYIMTLTDARNGWWRIKWLECAEEGNDIALVGSPTQEYWIHYSVVGLDTRNYGNERWCLRATPNEKGKPTHWFNEEIEVHPLQVQGDWVQVEYNGRKGWIEIEKLCDNPLTNCS